jgi:hypothetical protein
MRDSAATLSPNDEISVDDFRRSVEVAATTSDYPYAIAITSNIPLYDGRVVSRAHCKEWTRVLSDGPGAFVVKHTWKDLSSIDAATEIFNEIIASERAAGVGVGDHLQVQMTESGTVCKNCACGRLRCMSAIWPTRSSTWRVAVG